MSSSSNWTAVATFDKSQFGPLRDELKIFIAILEAEEAQYAKDLALEITRVNAEKSKMKWWKFGLDNPTFYVANGNFFMRVWRNEYLAKVRSIHSVIGVNALSTNTADSVTIDTELIRTIRGTNARNKAESTT